MAFLKIKDKSIPTIKNFEISLLGCQDNVLLINGNKEEAEDILLAGKVILDVSEPFIFKKVVIRFLGKLRIDVSTSDENMNAIKNTRELRYERYFFAKSWDMLLLEDVPEYQDKPELYMPSIDNDNNGENNLKSKFHLLGRLVAQNLKGHKKYYNLSTGHHELYFKTMLKGDITESLLGHKDAFVSYQIVCSIQQIGNLCDLICSKQVQIIRTLKCISLDAYHFHFSEKTLADVAYIAAWVPIGAVAIGSTTSLCCKISPLRKDVSIKSIELSLVEKASFSKHYSYIYIQKRIIEQSFLTSDVQISRERSANGPLWEDWNVKLRCSVPPNLSKVSQSCLLLNMIEIKHSIKLNICMEILSELITRTIEMEIPVYLYISPLIPIHTFQNNYFKEPSLYKNNERSVNNAKRVKDEIIFKIKDSVSPLSFDNEWVTKELIPPSYKDFKLHPKIEVRGKLSDRLQIVSADKYILECTSGSKKNDLFDSYIYEDPPNYKESPGGITTNACSNCYYT